MAPRPIYDLLAAVYNVRHDSASILHRPAGTRTQIWRCSRVGLLVPGADGSIQDVVLGFDDMKSLTVSLSVEIKPTLVSLRSENSVSGWHVSEVHSDILLGQEACPC